MFEAKILHGSVLKKIIEAIRELVTDANLDCNERGITMQVRLPLLPHFSFLSATAHADSLRCVWAIV